MEDFPFDFILSYKEEEYKVKPPPNLFKLKELASKKFEIEIEEMLYILENRAFLLFLFQISLMLILLI